MNNNGTKNRRLTKLEAKGAYDITNLRLHIINVKDNHENSVSCSKSQFREQ